MHFAEEAMQAGQFEVAGKVVKEAMPLAKKEPLLLRELTPWTGTSSGGRRSINLSARRSMRSRNSPTTRTPTPWPAAGRASRAATGTRACRCWRNRPTRRSPSLPPKTLPPPRAMIRRRWRSATHGGVAEKGERQGRRLRTGRLLVHPARPALNESETAKVDARLKEIADFADTAAASGRGAIALGNVALTKNGARVDGVAANAEKLLAGDHRSAGWDGVPPTAGSPATGPLRSTRPICYNSSAFTSTTPTNAIITTGWKSPPTA